MPSLNRVMLIGNLGSDPDVRQTEKGGRVARMRVATNQQWVDQRSGQSR